MDGFVRAYGYTDYDREQIKGMLSTISIGWKYVGDGEEVLTNFMYTNPVDYWEDHPGYYNTLITYYGLDEAGCVTAKSRQCEKAEAKVKSVPFGFVLPRHSCYTLRGLHDILGKGRILFPGERTGELFRCVLGESGEFDGVSFGLT